MPLLIALAVLAGLLVWRLWARDRAQAEMSARLDPLWHRLLRRKPCRWQLRDGRGALKEFRCAHCGVTAYSRTDRGPQECKRALRSSL